jgi:pheromone a factor receptor
MADIPFTVFSVLALFLCIPPAYFNYKLPYRPWATLILIGWIMINNLCSAVDSIIWASPDINTWWLGYGWCDIVARLNDMFVIGVPGSAVGICRVLADATDLNPAQKDLRCHRMRRNMIDLFLGVGFPLVIQAFKFICEYSRYHIEGVNGCTGTIEFSWPTLILYSIWGPFLCLVAGGYSCIPCT